MTLSDQKITVSDDAAHFGGQHISHGRQGHAQANVIDKHAQKITGLGKTYAELPQDDPNRDTVMTASFLQASLFTSVVAFGVAAMAAGIGIVLILLGWALRRLEPRRSRRNQETRHAMSSTSATAATSRSWTSPP